MDETFEFAGIVIKFVELKKTHSVTKYKLTCDAVY